MGVHGINVSLALLITSFIVYFFIHHPLIGTLCEVHAIIVWLKTYSYAFTNRVLRHEKKMLFRKYINNVHTLRILRSVTSHTFGGRLLWYTSRYILEQRRSDGYL